MSDSSVDKNPQFSQIQTNNSTEDNLPEIDIRDFIRETRPFYKVPHLRILAFYVFVITLSSTTTGFDGSLLNGLQSTEYWSPAMGHPTGHVLGALSNGTIFGAILAAPFAPFFCDRYGRKISIYIGESLVIIGSVLQGASTNYAFFLCARIVLGFGGAFASLASPALISEIAYPLHRSASTISYNMCWYLGAVVAAVVTYLTRLIDNDYSWKIPSYLQAFFALVQLFILWACPESPRFLIAKGREDKAREILSKYHIGDSTNQRDLEFIDFEIKEIEASLEAEKLAGANSKYSDFWTRKTYRKRLFLVLFTSTMMQLSGNGLVSYYLNKVLNSIGITELKEQLEINMCLMIYNLVISLVICYVANYFKRRQLFITSVSGMLLTYVIWTILSAINQQRNFKDKSLGQGVLAMIFFYYLSYNIGLNGLPFLYLTEILPYSHRAKGLNIFIQNQQIVSVYNGFVNPIAMDAIEWKYYIVYCCILAIELIVVVLFYPETSGRTLEEVAEVFGDGEQTKVAAIYSVDDKRNSFEHVEVA
ncbi:hypothetical protein WICMUC_005614 [Wickerhamomyces mucosus]|uniref:Major facilitator superfamily (MFS) profile domain-containing protein n=1 Tax=Wickerhamomyces mucosus TaxID=1378264 RepID=A0A9P8P7G5_9ASCO|nr:hypothetical protein WICMUC_005614 [Wickerhamomyces mucosus]